MYRQENISFNIFSARPWLPYTHMIHAGSWYWHTISSLINSKPEIPITFESFDNTAMSNIKFWFLSTFLEGIMNYFFPEWNSSWQAKELFGSFLYIFDKKFPKAETCSIHKLELLLLSP